MNDREDRAESPAAREAREAEMWRQIVDNFGERVVIDDPDDEADTAENLLARTRRHDRDHDQYGARGDLDDLDDPDADLDGFTPPRPGPTPLPEPRRLLAWWGVLGMPVLLVVFALVRYAPPTWAGFMMLVWFLAGFGYLVATMRRSDDDFDDGARL